MKPSSPSAEKGFFYGWVIVAVSMISMAFWFGVRTTFSLFFVTLIDHFKWSRAEAAGAQSLTMLTYTVMAPVVGILMDRIGLRRVLVPGILLMALGFFLCSTLQTLTQFYLFFGVMVGMGVTCVSAVPYTIVLARWFDKNRGMANGLAGVGIGMGPLLFVPFFEYLIRLRGWQFAYFIFSILILLIPLPLNALFLKPKPKETASLCQRDSSPKTCGPFHRRNERALLDQGLVSNETSQVKALMKTRRFWLLLLFPCLTVFGVYVVIVHHVRYLVDLGIDQAWAARLFAMMGALSGGFRFFWGWLSDYTGREITFTLGSVCFFAGILFLLLFQYFPSLPFLYLFAVLFGVGWGATTPTFMSVSADLYPGRGFGLIYGMVEAAIGVGAALGAWVAGYIFDQSHTYLWAFLLAMALNLVSVFLVWLLAPRKYFHRGH